jgi:hypothetical protein
MQEENLSIKNILIKEEVLLTDILKIIKSIFKKSRIYLLIIFTSFTFLSIIQYLNSPIEYTANAKVLVGETGANSNAINGAIGSYLGLNLSSSSDNFFGPDMYKDIIESQAFLYDLVTTELILTKNKKITILDYFELPDVKKNYKNNIYNLIPDFKNDVISENKSKIDSISNQIKNKITPEIIFSNQAPPIVELPSNVVNAIENMKSRISIEIKGKNIKIFVKMPDKFTSAIVAKFVVEKIINYVTVYKTIKQKRNVIFLESKVKEAELIYKNAQNKQADYKDNSLGVILIKAQTNEQILNNQMTIAFNIYSQLFMQLEQAKVDLNQETPIFSSIEAIGIPSIKSDPAFLKIFLKNIFLMIIISFFVLFINLFRK